MPYGVVLLLDTVAENAVREICAALDRAGIPSLGTGTPGWPRPHVSLLVCDHLDVSAAVAALAPLSAVPAPTLLLSSLGVFPSAGGVAFLGVVVTPTLLDLHHRTHLALAGVAQTTWEYYSPGQWVPHCTLAMPVAPKQMEAVLAAVGTALPIDGRGTSLGVVDASSGALTVISALAPLR
jgi:hypothetical protein